MLSDAIQMCLRLCHPLSLLSPTFISQRGVVQVREVSPRMHEVSMFRL